MQKNQIVLWVVLFTFLLSPTPTNAQEVVGNNEQSAYIGTGGLLLPSSYSGDQSSLKTVADCQDCVWAYTVFCMYDGDGLCRHSTSSCAPEQLRYRVWFGRTASTAQIIGSVCWGYGKPPNRYDVERYVADQVLNYVPKLSVTIAPPGGTITSVPVVAWTNQPQTYTPPVFKLAGRDIAINAFANWRWIWVDGKIDWKSVPGQPYPATQITHHYRTPGWYQVSVTTVWQGEYSIESIGTFPIGGDAITQTQTQQIQVAKANSVLIKQIKR